LDIDIQAETHDSVEDARATLSLYQKYMELTQSHQFNEVLLKVYELGRQTKWDPPSALVIIRSEKEQKSSSKV